LPIGPALAIPAKAEAETRATAMIFEVTFILNSPYPKLKADKFFVLLTGWI
jgi:hypothetical protein